MTSENQFKQAIAEAVQFFRSHFDKEQELILIHHNDADGLSSAVLLSKAIERLGGKLRRYCLEKPYPKVIEEIHRLSEGLIIYVDFGGRSAKEISKVNGGKNPVLILDHHLPEEVQDNTVLNLNPIFCGLRGDLHLSAAGVAFLFCQELDEQNKEYVHLALVGAIGDRQDHDDALVGFNKTFYQQALDQGLISHKGTSIRQSILSGYRGPSGGEVTVAQLSKDTTILGAVGYLQGGIEQGVDLCTTGYTPQIKQAVVDLGRQKEELFASMEQELQNGGLQQSNHVQWFDLKTSFHPLGVKMVGEFCDSIRSKPWVDQEKYIAGFQHVPDHIPGLGDIYMGATKVSMRIPKPLETKMFAGKAQSLLEILPPATTELGGFVDGCHSYSAATTVAKGQEAELVRKMESYIK